MKISQFTKNELDLFRKECNFTELELACFNLKAENWFSHTKQDLDAATLR